jgi:hypothetical protein
LYAFGGLYLRHPEDFFNGCPTLQEFLDPIPTKGDHVLVLSRFFDTVGIESLQYQTFDIVIQSHNFENPDSPFITCLKTVLAALGFKEFSAF